MARFNWLENHRESSSYNFHFVHLFQPPRPTTQTRLSLSRASPLTNSFIQRQPKRQPSSDHIINMLGVLFRLYFSLKFSILSNFNGTNLLMLLLDLIVVYQTSDMNSSDFCALSFFFLIDKTKREFRLKTFSCNNRKFLQILGTTFKRFHAMQSMKKVRVNNFNCLVRRRGA